MNNTSNNIPSVTTSDVINLMSKMFTNAIVSEIPLSTLPSVFLHGTMGVGKSSAVRDMCRIISKNTDKKCELHDIRLTLYSPVDLRGLPTIDRDKMNSVWLIPECFDFGDTPDVIHILFLDELTSCPVSVQAAAYQIV